MPRDIADAESRYHEIWTQLRGMERAARRGLASGRGQVRAVRLCWKKARALRRHHERQRGLAAEVWARFESLGVVAAVVERLRGVSGRYADMAEEARARWSEMVDG